MGLGVLPADISMPDELYGLLKNGRLPHAVVLESREKQVCMQTALFLSQWAVCTDEAYRPCGVCSACVKAQSQNHPDIYTALASGKTQVIAVDEIRRICLDAYIIPNEAKGKVYLLFDADKMQHSAQNAFLKVLEEPPQNILFILTCTSAQALLPTVCSRATVFRLDHQAQVLDPTEQKAQALALQIADALYKRNETPLLSLTGALSDKSLAKPVLCALSQLIRGALVFSVTGNKAAGSQSAELSAHIKKQGLLNLLEVIALAQSCLEHNVNATLFCTWLCAALRQQKND